MKKIDKLLITSFFGPYIVTFFIALFVLVMQMFWLYIDDIAGKGVGFFLLIELIGYMSVSFFPMALAIAVLISSVMVLGNLAEHYELTGIKSAGVPLWRTIMPLMFVVFGIAVFSFFCSNNLIPVSNLKFKSRLYDIRRQKPTLNLEEGAFNDDFKGFAIRIGKKQPDNRTIEDVMIYDQTEASKSGKMTVISAKKGEMYVTPDEKYFVMELFDGMQSYEPEPSGATAEEKNAPFTRTYFHKWTKIFDLGEFEMERTDAGLFKSHHSMLTIGQLKTAVDSIDRAAEHRAERLYEQTARFFYPLKIALNEKKRAASQALAEKIKAEKAAAEGAEDSSEPKKNKENTTEETQAEPTGVDYEEYMSESEINAAKIKQKTVGQDSNKKKKAVRANQGRQPLKQEINKPLNEYGDFAHLFAIKDRTELYDKAKSFSRTVQGQATSAAAALDRIRINRVKHVFEMHSKYSIALACLIFLFIGAPMGAIVRKGGFGYPLLISIIFFMIFVVVTIFSKNLAERDVLDAVLAGWMNCLVLAPFGFILTYMAMTDRKLFNPAGAANWFKKAAGRFAKSK